MNNTNDRVQLKQEEVVGSEVVLKDINPKTSSKSVDDSTTGVPLDKTIERLWNAINNKLSRIVNSVNGRTGVVVLNSEDVGLGNVDNVSFADIKNWIINKLILEFGNKRIRLYDDMAGLAQDIALNDESIRDSAFYCDHQDEKERRACIGYIYWDEGESRLSYMAKYINTIGSTDDSIIYNEKLGAIENGEKIRDYTGGKIGVNIHKDEDVLELYHGSNKNDSGLRINKEKLGGQLVFFDGVYGNGSKDDTDALLYFDQSSTPSDAKTVVIYIDDVNIGRYYLRRISLKEGDTIYCNFAGDNYLQNGSIYPGMNPLLMYRQPAIGRVTQAPSLRNPDRMYQIEFHTVHQNLGWGLEYILNHRKQNVAGTPTKSLPSELTLKLTQGTVDGSGNNMGNVSGLQVFKGDNDTNPDDLETPSKLIDAARYTVLPQGPIKVYDSPNSTNKFGGGLSITPDMSLCVMPVKRYASTNSLVKSCNWKIKSPMDLNSINDMKISSGTLNDMSLLGINLMKVVDNNTPIKFSNASGLRISSPIDNDNVSASWFGLSQSEYNKYVESIGSPNTVKNSGGLSVNVGKFLEISPSTFKNDGDYYDGGKVNVRISKGLIEDPNSTNRIKVNIGKGLKFSGNDNKIDVVTGSGLSIDDSNNLKVDLGKLDVYVNEHNNTPFTLEAREMTQGLKFDSSSGISVNIGKSNTAYNRKGLKIYSDPEYDGILVYGYYHNSKFYSDAKHTVEITPDASKIYIDLTNPIQTAYKYNSTSSLYVKTLLNGILGVSYDSDGGLGMRKNDGSLYIKNGPGLKHTMTVYKYASGKSYLNGSIVYVNTSTHKGVYIVTLTTDFKKYVRGYYGDESTFFTSNYQAISPGDTSTMYIDITYNTQYYWTGSKFAVYDDSKTQRYYTAKDSTTDINSGKLHKYLEEGYIDNSKFYSDADHTIEIDPEGDLYTGSTIFINKHNNVGYNYINKSFTMNYDVNVDINYYDYIAGKSGSMELQLPPLGCLSIYTGTPTSYTRGDLILKHDAGLTIRNGKLALRYGNGLTIDNNELTVKTAPGLESTTDGLGIKLYEYNGHSMGLALNSGSLSLAIDQSYFEINDDGKLSMKTSTGLTTDSDGLGIKLNHNSDNVNVSGLTATTSGLSLSINSNFFKIEDSQLKLKLKTNSGLSADAGLGINLSNNSGLSLSTGALSLSVDSTYFSIVNGSLTVNQSDTAKAAWKTYLGISST